MTTVTALDGLAVGQRLRITDRSYAAAPDYGTVVWEGTVTEIKKYSGLDGFYIRCGGWSHDDEFLFAPGVTVEILEES